MKIVRVTYTVKAEYAEQNQANIKKVMADLQLLHHPDINYNVCLNTDNKTFVHTAFFKEDQDERTLLELPSFIHFQQQLKASGPEVPPKSQHPVLVGASGEIFRA